jgi:hypothetical protein
MNVCTACEEQTDIGGLWYCLLKAWQQMWIWCVHTVMNFHSIELNSFFFQRNIKSELMVCGKEKKAAEKLERLQLKSDKQAQIVSFSYHGHIWN